MKFFIAVFLIAGLYPYVVAAAQDPGIKVETLLSSDTDWNGARYEAYPNGAPEISVLKITIPAHSTMSWHTHPMPNAAYILSGELTVEETTGNRRSFVAGQAVPETVNTRHRGMTGDQPVVLVVFYAGSKGMPLAVTEPE